MTKVHNQNSEQLSDVLYQFSLAKEIPDVELLDLYVRLYPDYADELTDLAVQLVVESKQPKTSQALAPESKVSPVVSRAMSKFQSALHAAKSNRAVAQTAVATATPSVNPFESRGPKEYRRIANELNANTLFLCKVRDGLIVASTYPAGFFVALAAAMQLPVEVVTAHLRAQRPVVARGQLYKADSKPEVIAQVTFEEAVKTSSLSLEQQRFLLNL